VVRIPFAKPVSHKFAGSTKAATTVIKENQELLARIAHTDLLMGLATQDTVSPRKLRTALTAAHTKDKLG
jgi:hypothetical protein